jgi:hypothetical protein
MSDCCVHKARDLGDEERRLIERWLGRSLANDETVSLSAYRPTPPADDKDREALRRSIVAQAREIGSRVNDARDEEIEALLDEAFAAVRNRRD